MPSFELRHDINCNEETFWKIFFDEKFNTELFKGHMGFPVFNVTAQNETDATRTRQVKVTPKMDMPGPVKKVLGDSFSYVEDGSLDKKTKLWKFKITPSSMADKIKNEGTMRIEANGPDKIKRIANITIEAKIFMIGGLIEDNARKALEDGWNKAAAFMNQWIKDGKHNPTT